jgi:hypothetical protein
LKELERKDGKGQRRDAENAEKRGYWGAGEEGLDTRIALGKMREGNCGGAWCWWSDGLRLLYVLVLVGVGWFGDVGSGCGLLAFREIVGVGASDGCLRGGRDGWWLGDWAFAGVNVSSGRIRRGRIGGGGLGGEIGRVGEGEGVVEHAGPGVVVVMEFGFGFDGGDGVEEYPGDTGEDSGVAGRDAVLGEGGEDFAEDVVDVGGGVKVPGERGGKLGAEAAAFEELLLIAGMKETQAGAADAQHTAAAAIGKGKAAEVGLCGVRTFCGHLEALFRK